MEKNKHHLKIARYLPRFLIVGALIIFLGFILHSWLDQEIEQKVEQAVERNYSIETKDSSSLYSKPSTSYQSETLNGTSEIDNNFIAGSFSDTFSGAGWLSGMDGRQDNYTTGITPIPDFDLIPVMEPSLPTGALECPQKACLISTGKQISIANGAALTLPNFSGSLVSLDLQPLSDTWILGLTSEEEGIFKGWFFVFDGQKFIAPTGVSEPAFQSRYAGNFDFAGQASHWLAFYGSYEGGIFEFSNNQLFNLSYLVNPKAMRGGFKPEVFRIGSDWFVFNAERGLPIFKFFSGKEELIIGGLYLNDLIDEKFSDDLRSLHAVEVNGKLFLELTGPSAKPFWFEFVDKGFSYPKKFQVTSKNLRINQPQEMGRARLAMVSIYPKNLEFKLFLANSAGNWQEARVGEWVYFPKSGKDLYWQIDFSGVQEPFFLDLVRVEYGLNKF